MNNNFNNQNKFSSFENKKKNLGLIILILVIVLVGLAVLLFNIKGGNNNSNNTANNNSENITNNDVDNNSSDVVPLNSYTNIAEKVDMKVNNTYVEDEYFFAIRITFKNNGNNDVILSTPSFDKKVIAYYNVDFVPKSIGAANATDKDIINEACKLRKIVQNDGAEITITSGDTEDTILKTGETLDGIIHCTITRVEGKANGVEPILMNVEHFSSSNKKNVISFDLRD